MGIIVLVPCEWKPHFSPGCLPTYDRRNVRCVDGNEIIQLQLVGMKIAIFFDTIIVSKLQDGPDTIRLRQRTFFDNSLNKNWEK